MSNFPSNSPIQKLEKAAHRVTEGVGSIWSLIIHTVLFVGAFCLVFFGIPLDRVLLVLTTILSLEAIYLAIFIQMSVNRNTLAISDAQKEIEEIADDVEGIAEDVEEIAEDVEEIADDVEGIQEDMQEIQEDVEEIADDVEGIQKDVEEIQEDVDEIQKDTDDTEAVTK